MRLPGAYRTARQVGLALGVTKERIRQIEDVAFARAARALGCTVRDVIAHLYAYQIAEHGNGCIQEDPQVDPAWRARRWKH